MYSVNNYSTTSSLPLVNSHSSMTQKSVQEEIKKTYVSSLLTVYLAIDRESVKENMKECSWFLLKRMNQIIWALYQLLNGEHLRNVKCRKCKKLRNALQLIHGLNSAKKGGINYTRVFPIIFARNSNLYVWTHVNLLSLFFSRSK